MSNTTTIDQTAAIVAQIVGGDIDADLDTIADAVRLRQQAIARNVGAALRPGSKIEIGGNISPKYMIGITGTVVRVAGKKAVITIAESQGRFTAGAEIKVPLTCCTPVD